MKSAEYWINNLNLRAHPEGGFYKELYRSPEEISQLGLPDRFRGTRSLSTSIYFLLTSQDRSLFHRIKSDEVWYYHAGSSLTLYILNKDGFVSPVLGPAVDGGESLQVIIPAASWFGAIVNDKDSYTLSGCNVAPGFDFQDFELANRSALLTAFPAASEVIEFLTLE